MLDPSSDLKTAERAKHRISLDLPPDPKPTGRPKLRHRRQKRPWLTPPLLTNMAWRGWAPPKTLKLLTRSPRQTPPALDFSLSANERPHRCSAHPRGKSVQPRRNTSPPLVMKMQWIPRSAARRRLERRRNQPSLKWRGSKCNQIQNRVETIPLPLPNIDYPNIDYPPKNINAEYKIDTSISDHSDNNKTITVSLPFINLFDSFPEYKTLMYWEIRAG